MQSKNTAYLEPVDHLRLLAALIVFAFHYFHTFIGRWRALPELAWLAPVTEGYTGVSLFFVLSGFIFALIGARAEIDYRSFLRNRVLRIAPLFLTVFVVAASIQRDAFRPADLLYVLVTNIGDPPTSKHFITGAAWSISVEFAFYLVLPFLLLALRKEGPSHLLRLVAIVLVVRCGAYLASERSTLMIYSTLIGRFDQFLIGMLAGVVWLRREEALKRHGRLLLFAATLVIWGGLALQARQASFFAPEPKNAFWILWPSVEALLWAGFVLGYLAAGIRWPGRMGTVLATAGSWSFSIYLWHALIIFIAAQALPAPQGVAGFALHGAMLLAAVLAFSALSFRAIERPFLDLRGDYARRPRG